MAHEKQSEKILNPDGAMDNAKALLEVANHLDAYKDPKLTGPLLFHGFMLTVPTLLALATELALKALIMRDVGAPPQSHDLLDLFDRLPERTRQRLKKKMPGAPPIHPQLPPIPPGIREVLEENRNLFAEWRYLHESRGAWAGTGMLKEALSVIIDTYEEPTPPPEFSPPDARDS